MAAIYSFPPSGQIQPQLWQQPMQALRPQLAAVTWGMQGNWDMSNLWLGSEPGPYVQPEEIGPLEGAGRMAEGGGIISAASHGHPHRNPGLMGYPGAGPRGHYLPGSQGAGGKRPMLEVNHNKAITKKLASAVHYQQVLDCVSDSVQYFDEVNVATALHRLAKLQPPSPSGHPSPVIYADQFQQLVLAIKRLLNHFEAQAVSNTMWAFATLAYFPEDNLLEDLAQHAVSIMSTFRPQATSNTLWAFAKLSYCPCEALLQATAQQMVHDLAKSVPQDISNTLWAFATLRHYPGEELMKGAAQQATQTMQRFKPQEIANTLWSFATLGHDPDTQLLDAMAIQMVARIQQFRPQAVSNSLWAYAKLGYNPGKLLLDVTAQKATGMLHQYTSQEVANTLWALATLEHHPGAPMLDAAAVQVSRRMEQFSPQDTTNSIWAFAKLFHYPCKELMQGVALYTLRHWHRFKPQELVTVLWSLAVLRACPPDTWRLLLAKLAALPLAGLEEADLHLLHQTFLVLETSAGWMGQPNLVYSFPQALREASEKVWKASVRKTGSISRLHEEVSRVLWSLGVVHRNEHITADGLACVDIALEDDTQVALDIQGPPQFSVNSHRPLGRTVARRIILEARGLTLLPVPYFEWNCLHTLDQQKGYLMRLLTQGLHPQDLAAAQLSGAALQPVLSQSPGGSGLTLQRKASQGLPASRGLPSQGLPAPELLSQGLYTQGLPTQELLSQGPYTQGLSSQGLSSQGLSTQGLPLQGLPLHVSGPTLAHSGSLSQPMPHLASSF